MNGYFYAVLHDSKKLLVFATQPSYKRLDDITVKEMDRPWDMAASSSTFTSQTSAMRASGVLTSNVPRIQTSLTSKLSITKLSNGLFSKMIVHGRFVLLKPAKF